ncbi:FAD-dependent oxidoreductase [Siminovitchia acidinfaciens]|uniref:FAD-dependent oxidoreductase n=1 Tax=Siminovitchia acidinfaciens TaxID=2321395 RepID=A0A429Y749_9BACI|nr:FAD-binding oxidoreductase [Siminovitchia acidinfaciens]RST77287.1 FAD-dependent oxidoreductase [Siminovitchia acidinfaciens]
MKEENSGNAISYWLDTAKDDIKERPTLKESITADIAIMGAGFTGLWTAYYLLEKDPSLKIVIMDKGCVGFGASGRNGGWCSSKFSVSPATCIKRYGKDIARQIQLSMFDSVTEIERVIEKENINADWTLGGSLQIARGDHHLLTLEKAMATYQKLDLEEHFQLLDQLQTDQRVRINGASGSLLSKTSAVLNPGKLVRRLAETLEQRGVQIYENSEVVKVVEGNGRKSPKLVTRNGAVNAKHAIVLAGEAYMTQMRNYQRNLIPMYSLITLTEPLTEEQWSSIGWGGRETVGSTRLSVDYLQRTADGRILFGGRGQPYQYKSKISNAFDRHEKTHNALKERLYTWFPSLKGISFTHDWGGPVGVTRDWTPNFLYNKKTKVASAWGYAGQGVSTTNLGGRIMSDLLLEQQTEVTKLPMVQHKSKKWEPEPFRWMGVRFVQSGLSRIDEKAELNGKAPSGKTLVERLGRN